jgi:hypothetical protein
VVGCRGSVGTSGKAPESERARRVKPGNTAGARQATFSSEPVHRHEVMEHPDGEGRPLTVSDRDDQLALAVSA